MDNADRYPPMNHFQKYAAVGRAALIAVSLTGLSACWWNSGPERPRMIYSPSGEPLVGGIWPVECKDAVGLWFDRADTNHDGNLTLAELMADARRQFQVMDTRHDGRVTAAALSAYRQQVMGGRYASVSAADNAALNDMAERERQEDFPDDKRLRRGFSQADLNRIPTEQPDPVMSADADLDGSVTWEEFQDYLGQVFIELDGRRAGYLTKASIQTFCVGGRY